MPLNVLTVSRSVSWTAGSLSQSAASRRLMTSFSRWRSSIFSARHLGPQRQMAQARHDAPQFLDVRVLRVDDGDQPGELVFQNGDVRARRDRQLHVEVVQEERAALVGQANLPRLENLAELVAQDGQQDLLAQGRD